MSNNIILYGGGLFEFNWGSMNDAQLDMIQNSGFTTVVLWAMHVDAQGNFIYNNSTSPLVQNGQFVGTSGNPDFVNQLNQLKTGGTVKQYFISIGGWGCQDFTNMQNLIQTEQGQATLIQNFKALAENLPISGIDFDMEESYDTDMLNTIVWLTGNLSQLGLQVTYCPYQQQNFWFNCLAQSYTKCGNRQPVSWLNLQCYAGGASNTPTLWALEMRAYGLSKMGITNPNAFIMPGYWCRNAVDNNGGPYNPSCPYDDCPSTIQNTFAQLSKTDPGICGGFIWNSSDIFTTLISNPQSCTGGTITPADYAQAIINGLAGKTSELSDKQRAEASRG